MTKRFQITITELNVHRCGIRKEASRIVGELQLAILPEYLNKKVFIDTEGKTNSINLFYNGALSGLRK